MNNYDGSRQYEMDEFLNFLMSLALSSQEPLYYKVIYNTLCFKNLAPHEKEVLNGYPVMVGKSNEELFSYWRKKFEKSRNTNAFCDEHGWPYFFQFLSKNKLITDEFIKLYIPLDMEHLKDGAVRLFEFLDRMGIKHGSKISKHIRVDNVIIRLAKNDTESARRIIDFISNDPYLSNGLNRVNPFIPTISGIGYMVEHGNSYNTDISYYLADFINRCKANNITNVNSKMFYEYLINCKRRNYTLDGSATFDPSLLDVFEEAYFGRKKKVLNERYTREQKKGLLLDALKATYVKYGFNQVVYAINEIINSSDYGYISNGKSNVKYRDELMKYVTPSEIMDFINESIMTTESIEDQQLSNPDKVFIFCDQLFSDTLPLEIDEICGATLERYGDLHLQFAIHEYINTGQAGKFTRYSQNNPGMNFRGKIKTIDHSMIFDILKRSLILKGVDISQLDPNKVVSTYVNTLKSIKYSSFEETPQFGV